MVIDLLHFAKGIPTLPVQRRISIAAVVAARAACRERPRWTAIFTKAYGLMTDEVAEFRRVYVKLPWAHLYEYPISRSVIMIEREYQGESCVFSISIRNPADYTLVKLSRILQHATTAPIEEIKDFRRMLQISSLPFPIRRLLWWLGLNIGRQRSNYFGTFGVSVYSALNAESLHPLGPTTSVLNYGMIDRDGEVNVRIIYDHRVLNGATVARALDRLEHILNTTIVEELRSLESSTPAHEVSH
jgi:hypothetical protein